MWLLPLFKEFRILPVVVTSSDALVASSFLSLVAMHLLRIVMHLALVLGKIACDWPFVLGRPQTLASVVELALWLNLRNARNVGSSDWEGPGRQDAA